MINVAEVNNRINKGLERVEFFGKMVELSDKFISRESYLTHGKEVLTKLISLEGLNPKRKEDFEKDLSNINENYDALSPEGALVGLPSFTMHQITLTIIQASFYLNGLDPKYRKSI